MVESLFKWSHSINCHAYIFFFKIKNCLNDDLFISWDDRIGKCCITSAYLQWLCHSGERPMACGLLVISPWWGWLGVAKLSWILRHQGVQLILAYSFTRLAILVVGKDRGGMFLFFLFLHFHLFSFLSCSSLSSPLPSLLSLFSLSLGDDTKWPTGVNVSLSTNTINTINISPWIHLWILI